jgi:hypothetical protein
MHNHGTSTSLNDEFQEFELITQFKVEFLKQLLADTEIERSETLTFQYHNSRAFKGLSLLNYGANILVIFL